MDKKDWIFFSSQGGLFEIRGGKKIHMSIPHEMSYDEIAACIGELSNYINLNYHLGTFWQGVDSIIEAHVRQADDTTAPRGQLTPGKSYIPWEE